MDSALGFKVSRFFPIGCLVSGVSHGVGACVALAVDGVLAANAALRPASGGPSIFPPRAVHEAAQPPGPAPFRAYNLNCKIYFNNKTKHKFQHFWVETYRPAAM